MYKVNIRKATSDDIPAIFKLVKELAAFEKAESSVWSTLKDYEVNFKSGLFGVHVAEVRSGVVGLCLYYPTFSTWKGKMLYLEDFIVNSDYRNHGIGQKLYNAFIAEAKIQGCKLVKWEVLDWNEGAIRFYERNGAIIEKNWWDCKIIFERSTNDQDS